jgi:hypothetical protein
MSVHDAAQAAPVAASRAASRRLGVALLAIATAQLMLVFDSRTQRVK